MTCSTCSSPRPDCRNRRAAGRVLAERSIDALGLIACPGLVDLSARLGGIEPELGAAVAGGVTSLACPPDTKPPLDEPGLVERLVGAARQRGWRGSIRSAR
jgi:dihydroorotase-like cyclic amidohydrolase